MDKITNCNQNDQHNYRMKIPNEGQQPIAPYFTSYANQTSEMLTANYSSTSHQTIASQHFPNPPCFSQAQGFPSYQSYHNTTPEIGLKSSGPTINYANNHYQPHLSPGGPYFMPPLPGTSQTSNFQSPTLSFNPYIQPPPVPYPPIPFNHQHVTSSNYLRPPMNNYPIKYSPITVPTLQPEEERKNAQKYQDQEWVKEWERKKSKSVKTPKRTVKIYEFRLKLAEAVKLVEELKECVVMLSTSKSTDDEQSWTAKTSRTMLLQKKLEDIKREFLTPEILDEVKKKLTIRKKKRERDRLKARKRREKKAEELMEREKKHNIVDEWRGRLEKEVADAKQKEEMKAEADNVLGEVRKKIQETKRVQQQLGMLEKLRQARKENATQKGLQVSIQSTSVFEEKVDSIRRLVQSQLEVYLNEEKTLQAMLESEREELREKKESSKQKAIMEDVEKRENQILCSLFGEDSLDPNLQLFYSSFFPSDINSLVTARYGWDQFINQNDPQASHIPINWVETKPPSNLTWTNYLQENQ